MGVSGLWAILPLLGVAAASQPAEDAPRRAWAHEGAVVDLPLNAPSRVTRNALDSVLIQEAFARWGLAYDEGRLDVVASLFTEDAQMDVLLASTKPITSARGRDQIVASARSAMAQQGDQRRHIISNVVIEQLSATKAKAIAYGLVALPSKAAISTGATVIYSADLVKDGDVWRFSRFVIGMDSYIGTPPKIPN